MCEKPHRKVPIKIDGFTIGSAFVSSDGHIIIARIDIKILFRLDGELHLDARAFTDPKHRAIGANPKHLRNWPRAPTTAEED